MKVINTVITFLHQKISKLRGSKNFEKLLPFLFVATIAVIGTMLLVASSTNTSSGSLYPKQGGQNVSGATIPPPPSRDWWHTSGNRILNGSGQNASLRGADDGQLNIKDWTSTSPAPDATEMKNLSSWGLGFLRLGVTWANLEPTAPTGTESNLAHNWNQVYLTQLDNVVKLARQNNVRVVLDMHQAAGWSPKFGGEGLPGWLYPNLAACTRGTTCTAENTAHCEFLTNSAESGVPIQPQTGLISAWQLLASRYKADSTVIGLDLFNEPQGCTMHGQSRTFHVPSASDNPLDAFYLQAGSAVRQVNPNLLLIYEDAAYETYLSQGNVLADKLNLPNAVLSKHYYPDSWSQGNFPGSCKSVPSPSGQTVLAAYRQQAAQYNQPLYIGEFDGFRLTRGGGKCPLLQSVDAASNDLLSMMAYSKTNAINWSLWRYDRSNSMVDSSGNPRQPLIKDLQTGL